MRYQITRETANKIREVIEDSVSYLCDENMVSGQLIWTLLECLAQAKLAELSDNLTNSHLDQLSSKTVVSKTKSDQRSDW